MVQVSILVSVYILVEIINGNSFLIKLNMTICKLHSNDQMGRCTFSLEEQTGQSGLEVF